MDTIERFRREFAYDDWANGEVLRALQSAAAPPASCVRWLAHVVGTKFLWLARILNEPSAHPVWPEFTLREIEARIGENRGLWTSYLDALDARELARDFPYKNSKGEDWNSRVEDVLAHVLLHGSYHRGQIASALRAAGVAPPLTDFIYAIRSGLVE